jgi:hypothetical protein
MFIEKRDAYREDMTLHADFEFGDTGARRRRQD